MLSCSARAQAGVPAQARQSRATPWSRGGARLALQWLTAFRSFVRIRAPPAAESHAARALAKVVTVPDVHASDVLERMRAAHPTSVSSIGHPSCDPSSTRYRHRHARHRPWAAAEVSGKKTRSGRRTTAKPSQVSRFSASTAVSTRRPRQDRVCGRRRKSYSRVEREVELLGFRLYLEAILDVKAGLAHYRPQDPGTLGGRMYRQPSPADILRFWLRRRARPQRGVERP